MSQHFVDPSSQQLSPLYREFKTSFQIISYNAMKDSKGDITTVWWSRSQRELTGMPVLNSVSVGTPVTKLQKPVGTSELLENFVKYSGKTSRFMSYSYEDRFIEPLLPLIVHYFYEVIHGPDYIHTLKGERLRDSFLCLGNLKACCPLPRPVVDKLIMNYIFLNKKFQDDMETLALETADEAFNFNGNIVREKMMFSPSDVGSVARFFTNAAIVANVMTSKEVKLQKRNVSSSLFATRVSNLFETLEDKTSINTEKLLVSMVSDVATFLLSVFVCVHSCVHSLSSVFSGMFAMFSA